MPDGHETTGETVEGQNRLVGRRYRLVSPVGRGGMGMVWHAHDVLLDRDVAVKELLLPFGLDHAGKQVAHRRMMREARSAARLSHPGIVTVHDVVEEDGRPWIVMELVRAWSLEQAVRQSGPLPVVQAAEIGIRVLDALRHAHAAGILHRDVKPGNVLLTSDRVVLTDFGIAAIEGDVTITQTGLLMGSPAYIPPERLQGQAITHSADLWSFGATLYAAVEGRPPYEGPDAMAVLGAVLTQEPSRPQRAGALLPVIEGLLRKNPADRLTAVQVSDLLERVLRSHGSGSTGQPPEPAPMPTPADSTPMRLLPPLDPPSGPMPSRIVETPSGPVRVPYEPAADVSDGHGTPYDALAGPSGPHRAGAGRAGAAFDPMTSPSAPQGFDAFGSPSGPQDPFDQRASGDPFGRAAGPQDPFAGVRDPFGNPSGGHDAFGGPSGPQDPFGNPSGPHAFGNPSGGYDAFGSPSGPQNGSGDPSGPRDPFGNPSGPHAFNNPSGPQDPFGNPSGPHPFNSPSGPHDPFGNASGPQAFNNPSGPQDPFGNPSGPHAFNNPSAPQDPFGNASGPQDPFGGQGQRDPFGDAPGRQQAVRPRRAGYDALSSPSTPMPAEFQALGAAPAPQPGRGAVGAFEALREQTGETRASRPRSELDERRAESARNARRRNPDGGGGWLRGRRPTLRLLLAAAGAAGVAVLAVLLLQGGSPEPAPPSSPAPTAAAPSTLTADTGGGEVPDGFTTRAQAGITAAVPEDWKTSVAGNRVTFAGPRSSGESITVDRAGPASDGGLAALGRAREGSELTEYIQVQLQRASYGSWKAADWEYTHTLSNGVPMHTLVRHVTVDARRAYKITFATPDLRWDDSAETRSVFFDNFAPED
ncbi:serine/threonine-protein kinase [Streptosporangium sp. KLBMP 9127]|nr:protein kinase [Streptosporangium sp. KLBMP 9127]